MFYGYLEEYNLRYQIQTYSQEIIRSKNEKEAVKILKEILNEPVDPKNVVEENHTRSEIKTLLKKWE